MLEYSRVTINGVEITGDPQPTTREAAELRHPSIVIEEEAARRITQILFDHLTWRAILRRAEQRSSQ